MSRPLSEEFRLAGEAWVDADAAARVLEEAKSTVFAQRCNKLIAENFGLAMNRIELIAKADPSWRLYLEDMIAARTKANMLKIHVEFLRMRAAEQQSAEASKRAEMRLT